MNYTLDLAKRATKQLAELPRADRERVAAALRAMQNDPYAGDVAPLKGERFAWRRRVGNYRIMYALIPSVDTFSSLISSDAQRPPIVSGEIEQEAR